MYLLPPFVDDFDRPDGELLAPWIVSSVGTLGVVSNSLTSADCGIGLLPFSARNFGVSAVLDTFSPGTLATLVLKCTEDSGNGFSISVQSDLTLHIEATVNGVSTVIEATAAISIGDTFGLHHYVEDGVQKLQATKGSEVLATVDVPARYLGLAEGTFCGVWLSSGASLSFFRCEEFADETLPLVPLQNSWAANEIESDLKALFIQLYKDNLLQQAEEMTVYGMPHLGQFSLVERLVTADGLAVIRQGDESGMRYLYKAWKNRNPKRGLHFLRTYLQVLFGGGFDVAQLWQEKNGLYPEGLKTEGEIALAAEDLDEYFLTSRIRVDLDTELIPNNVIQSLRTALAARFVLEMRIAKFFESEWFLGNFVSASNLLCADGQSLPPAKMSENQYTFVNIANASVVFNGAGETLHPTPPY